MRRYYEALGRDPFQVIPLTFHVKKGTEDPEFYKFLEYYKKIESEIESRESSTPSVKDKRKNNKN